MTPKQRIFADEYIKTRNATQAYKVAYPSVKSYDTAGVLASRMLKNDKIIKYIDERLQAMSDKTIADAAEIMAFYTKVMRGELGDITVDARGDEHQTPPKMSDRNAAAEKLAKMLGIDKLLDLEKHRAEMAKLTSGDGTDAVRIIDDV